MANFVPLYQRIKERLRADILSAQGHNGGARLPTERELQARYRVSRPTISKALTALAAEGLLVKAQGRGSFLLPRHPSEPFGASSPSRRIGYVAPLSGEELVRRIFTGMDRAAHRRDYRVLMGSAGNNVARERAAALELIASGARGLVIYPVSRRDHEVADDYLRREEFGVPIVLIDTCAPEQGHAQVIFDNRRAGYAMTSWLIGRGHRRIGLLSYPEYLRHSPLAARLKGYQDALLDCGIAPDPALARRFDPDREEEELAFILEEWLRLPEPPTAIIATEDTAALELIEQLQMRGVRVPEEVRVVGFDNREASRRFRPAFTTTNPDFERMGEVACEIVLEGVEAGEIAPRTHILDVPLLVRRSPEVPAAQPREMAAR
jgi:GntR family transcriptional regulator of arabinose operon